MQRLDDWQERLAAAFETARALPFAYGTHDCALFAAYCVDRMTGSALARRIAEEHAYADEATATEVLAAGGGLEALVTAYLGEPSPSALCRRGDVMLFSHGPAPGLGIHDGQQIIAPREGGGLAGVPTERALKGWRV